MPKPKDPDRIREWKNKISVTLKRKGIKPPSRKGCKTIHSDDTKRRISQKLKGHLVSDTTRKRIGAKQKGVAKPWVAERMRNMTGENSLNWKGGVTPLRRRIRASAEYDRWRKRVFERDDWTCRECGKRGGNLEAHHIIEFYRIIDGHRITTFEDAMRCEMLWGIENGVTLCRECHNKTKKGKLKK